MQRIVVIGAGPAGLAAAIAAAQKAADVTVLEQMSRPGAKLLATGGGKCNLTNVLPALDLAGRFGRQGRFMLPALEALSPDALRQFFTDRGVPTRCDDGFHYFPISQRAGDVLDALIEECYRYRVRILTGQTVTGLQCEDDRVTGVITENEQFAADRVIVATGGKGYPGLGGKGIGYALAAKAGHEIVEPTPGLVGLRTAESWPGECTGISFTDTEVSIDLPKYRQYRGKGELLFTHRGISGPAVIDLSAEVGVLLRKHPGVPLRINLFAARTAGYWQEQFNRWQQENGKKHVINWLSEGLPHSVAEALCREAGDVGHRKAAEFSGAEREKLALMLTAAPVTATGSEGWEKAMVTRGGVSLKKVDPNTLESRLISGLYFAGEVLDLDGPCGGFNLQWAFSSGWLAGGSAAE